MATYREEVAHLLKGEGYPGPCVGAVVVYLSSLVSEIHGRYAHDVKQRAWAIQDNRPYPPASRLL